MTLKLRGRPLSVKICRRLKRIPAEKRLGDYMRAGWLKRYRLRNTKRVPQP
jgi:hypothetical protein